MNKKNLYVVILLTFTVIFFAFSVYELINSLIIASSITAAIFFFY